MSIKIQTTYIKDSPHANQWSTYHGKNIFILWQLGHESENKNLKEKIKHITNINQLCREFENRKLNAFIALFEKKSAHFACVGKGNIRLSRKGKTEEILSSDETGEGSVEDNDTLLFSPQSFPTGLLMLKVEKSGLKEGFKNHFNNQITIIKTVLNKFIQNIVHNKSFSPKKKITLLLIFILITVLGISLGINIYSAKKSEARRQLEESLLLLTQQYEEAESLLDLNPVRARDILASAKVTVGSLLNKFPKNSREFKEINEWIEKISLKEVEAYRIYKLTAVPLFFDIAFIKPGGVGNSLSIYQDTIAILDSQNKVLYTLGVTTKQSQILAGPDTVKEAKSVTIHGKLVYVINGDGVVGVDIGSKSSQVLIPHDSEWGEIIGIAGFAGNIYLLDKTNQTVWKYIATEQGFTAKVRYVNPADNIPLTDAGKLTIDGFVWITTPHTLMKFSQGVRNQFQISGISDSLGSFDDAASTDTDKYLYLLDKTLARIVVTDKDGVYLSQYQWSELKNAQSIVVSEKAGKIFVLIGNKIYGIDLK